MKRVLSFNLFSSVILIFTSSLSFASGTMSEEDLADVQKTHIESEQEQARIEKTAGMLANYEIEANKLLDMLEGEANSQSVSTKASELLTLSENIIESARFRLPQCDKYLSMTLELKPALPRISHEALEKDYHHDGALPKAGAECYHTKDLFVHAATVIVLTRDDPKLSDDTKQSIKAEITEVLAHTELVRQLVIY